MTTQARIYVTLILLLGICVLCLAFANWSAPGGSHFTELYLLAVAASVLRVVSPAFAGGPSLTYVLVLLGLLDLSYPETLVIGCTAVVIDCVWDRKRNASLLEVYLTLANMAVAISVANRLIELLKSIPAVPDWADVAAGAVALFVCNTFPLAAVAALSQARPVGRIWRESHLPVLPSYAGSGALAYAVHAGAEWLGWHAALLTLPVLYLLYRTYRMHVDHVEQKSAHAEQLSNVHLRTIEALALAIEAKDTTTSDHLRRVQVYAVELGKELGMSADDLQALQTAAILHDIGKLAVPEYIISKPGRLTPEEFEKMKVHPVVGAEILQHVQFPYPVVPIVEAHHEKWNGTGYPYGLRGKDIPLGARILSAVDVLDALASDRQYRRALPLDTAMEKIREESGRSFDPAVVEVLSRRYRELERIAQEKKGATLKLSTDMRITRGSGPAAGYEQTNKVALQGSNTLEILDLHEAVALARRDVRNLFDKGLNAADMELNEICSVFAFRIQRVVPFEAIAIWLLQDDKLVPFFVHGHDHRLFSSLRIPFGQGLSGWVAENRKPIINGNPTVESGYLNNSSIFSTLRSALAIPLEGSTGHVIGVLTLYDEARDAFTRDHLRVLHVATPRLALAVESLASRAGQHAAGSAGLVDAAKFMKHLDAEMVRTRRLNSPLALLVCSVEGLAELPETEAFAALQSASRILRDGCRDYDVLGKITDSEFVLVLPGLPDHGAAARAAQLCDISLPAPGAHLLCSYSMFPDDGGDAEELLAAADRKLYRLRAARSGDAAAAPAARGAWVQ